MNNKNQWRRVYTAASITAALTLGSASVAHASDFDWPRMLIVGTTSTATGGFASSNAWAPIMQKQTDMAVRIIPEDSEFIRNQRLTVDKNIHISSVSVAETRLQTEGYGAYAGTKPVPQRILWHHNDTPWGLVVAGDSELKTVDDLKKGGVRMSDGIWTSAMTTTARKSIPAYLGLSEDEAQETISYVPAGSYAENCRSVVEGKVDVAWCATISGLLSEMEGAPGGIRWLPMDSGNSEAWDRFLNHSSMVVPTEISIGVSSAHGVDGATSNFVYSAPADMDTDLAYNLAKWFHESYDDYKGTHPLAARMSLEQFRNYLDRSPLPVHEGTVKYLREIGAWTEEDDIWNQQAIAKMDRWMEARKAARAEALENRVKMSFDNQEYLDILAKHTKGLETFRSRL